MPPMMRRIYRTRFQYILFQDQCGIDSLGVPYCGPEASGGVCAGGGALKV